MRVAHGAPGALRNRIGRQASDLYLVVRLSAPWTTVRAAPGTTFRVTADGPKGERWRWTFRTSSGNPESDSSGYVGCLRPMAGVVSFARHLRTVRGRWTFTVDVVGGRVKGASGAVAVTVR